MPPRANATLRPESAAPRELGKDLEKAHGSEEPDAPLPFWKRPATHLVIATGLLFANVNVMAPTLTAIADDFSMTEQERDRMLGGDVNAAFWLLGAPIALVHSFLAEQCNRRDLFAWTILSAMVPSLLSLFITQYWELLVVRSLCGIAVAGVVPTLYSLLGDMFPAEERAGVSNAIGSAMGGGLILGQIAAASIGPTLGWRVAFVAVAAPSVFWALLCLVLVEEPQRGAGEEALAVMRAAGVEYEAALDLDAFLDVFRVRTNVLVFAQGLPGTIPQALMSVFFNDFLLQDCGLAPQTATAVIIAFGIGAAVGGIGGGVLGGWIYGCRRALVPVLVGVTAILSVVPMQLLVYYPFASASLVPPFAFAFLAGTLSNVAGNNLRTILLNVNMPEARGAAFCLFNIANAIGRGAGPAIISTLIEQFGGRVPAFAAASLFWVLSGICMLGMCTTLSYDEVNKNAKLHKLSSRRSLRFATRRIFVHRRLGLNTHADLPIVAV